MVRLNYLIIIEILNEKQIYSTICIITLYIIKLLFISFAKTIILIHIVFVLIIICQKVFFTIETNINKFIVNNIQITI